MKMTPEQLFMPEGKIPLPAWVPKRGLYPGSSFEFYSRRLGRRVYLTFENEYLFALLVEFNPNIKWFVEHYPKVKLLINNKHVQTIFDMLIRFISGEFLLVEVKRDKNDLSCRENEQTMRQRTFAELCRIPYVIVDKKKINANKIFINNLRDIVGYLPLKADERVKDDISVFIRTNKAVKIMDVVNGLNKYDTNEVITGIVQLLHKETIVAPLDTIEFGMSLELTTEGRSYDFFATL